MTKGVAPAPLICQENKRLRDALIEAVREVMQLQDQQSAALARGEMEALPRFDITLAALRRKRDRIREAIRLHISNHGCEVFDLTF